jgi:hypothetical protein
MRIEIDALFSTASVDQDGYYTLQMPAIQFFFKEEACNPKSLPIIGNSKP